MSLAARGDPGATGAVWCLPAGAVVAVVWAAGVAQAVNSMPSTTTGLINLNKLFVFIFVLLLFGLKSSSKFSDTLDRTLQDVIVFTSLPSPGFILLMNNKKLHLTTRVFDLNQYLNQC
jgi:hypothetical protein